MEAPAASARQDSLIRFAVAAPTGHWVATTTQLEPEKGAMRGWWSYWGEMVNAHHASGEHERALDLAVQAKAPKPL